MCGGQSAYPVYVTVANISKQWRRKSSEHTMVLLGYLPTDPFEDIENDDERRRLKADLVHRCMEMMLAPLKEVWEDGVDMWCPDGRLRRVYPRIAAYMADWPEQNLQCCTSISGCPTCATKQKGRGDLAQQSDPRQRDETLGALRAYFLSNDVRELTELGLKPVWPWWGDLPDVDLHQAIAPDILHQLYQGVFKSHLVKWLKFFVGADVLDDRFAAMPRAEGLTHFPKGISVVKQWTGKESKEMLRQILPAVLGDLRPEEAQLARSLVDFIFRAHASSMTETDLAHLEYELDTFHKSKDVLIARGYYQSSARFDRIAKLHALSHYVDAVREFGTPDGYSTEVPEHLHIEYAKVPWRASNKVKPLPQMLTYIQRQEAIRLQRAYLDRYLGVDRGGGRRKDEETEETAAVYCGAELRDTEGGAGGEEDIVRPEDDSMDEEGDVEVDLEPVAYPNPSRHMAVNPTKQNVLVKDVIRKYQASDLTSAITHFLTRRCGVPEHDVMLSPNNRLQVWHRLYLHHEPLPFAPFESPRRDVVRASAPVFGPGGRMIKEGVWDTALYLERPNQLSESFFPIFRSFFLTRDAGTIGCSHGEQREKYGLQRMCPPLLHSLNRAPC
jgi:hypothetical protein